VAYFNLARLGAKLRMIWNEAPQDLERSSERFAKQRLTVLYWHRILRWHSLPEYFDRLLASSIACDKASRHFANSTQVITIPK
jgi:hypothetical protein